MTLVMCIDVVQVSQDGVRMDECVLQVRYLLTLCSIYI